MAFHRRRAYQRTQRALMYQDRGPTSWRYFVRDLQVIDRPPATPTRAGALDRLTRAICVVSASSDGIPHAATIDSFTFVSTEPAVAMVSLTTGSTMLDVIERAGAFAVSVLAYDQEVLARHFGSRSRGFGWAQFEGVDVSPGRWTNALYGGPWPGTSSRSHPRSRRATTSWFSAGCSKRRSETARRRRCYGRIAPTVP